MSKVHLNTIIRTSGGGRSNNGEKDLNTNAIQKKRKMDEHNRKLLKALKFLGNHTAANIRFRYLEQKEPDFRQAIPTDMEAYLLKKGYMTWNEKRGCPIGYLITDDGDAEKRKLKKEELKDIGIVISIIVAILLLLNLLNILWGLKNIWNAIW